MPVFKLSGGQELGWPRRLAPRDRAQLPSQSARL